MPHHCTSTGSLGLSSLGNFRSGVQYRASEWSGRSLCVSEIPPAGSAHGAAMFLMTRYRKRMDVILMGTLKSWDQQWEDSYGIFLSHLEREQQCGRTGTRLRLRDERVMRIQDQDHERRRGRGLESNRYMYGGEEERWIVGACAFAFSSRTGEALAGVLRVFAFITSTAARIFRESRSSYSSLFLSPRRFWVGYTPPSFTAAFPLWRGAGGEMERLADSTKLEQF